MQKATNIKTISILGCGWLGLPLGAYLVEKGYQVKGSVTNKAKGAELEAAGIKPYVIRLNPSPEGDSLDAFLDSDLVIISIPPKFREHQMLTWHAEQVKYVKEAVERLPIDKVIYISSTAVYPDTNGIVNENSSTSQADNAKSILLAEELLRINTPFDTTILRCGGLMGYDRMLCKYLAGKKGIETGDLPVNYIHRDDVIGIIEQVILQDKWNTVLNAVAPEHPSREALCIKQSEEFGYEMPEFEKPRRLPDHKTVSGQKLKDKLGYEFKYPNPLTFAYSSPKVY
ncbi:NAD(P)H-binding protein [Limibacter armeniacum]|uniref:NAD(P)H-binding protein n=1 Tax=Limibacter armeniacum TaxID=466084 RepID=UPI002FE5C6B3